MKVRKDHIASYIPQRPPFIMIDQLIEANKDVFETSYLIPPDNIFLEGTVLREYALIENIAQSCAAGISFLNSSAQSAPGDGFIGGISKLVVHALPKVHDTIRTIIIPLHQFDNMYLLKGTCYIGEEKLLECEIKLAGMPAGTL